MEEKEYIGISDNRMQHIVAVARKCYKLAKTKHGMNETDAQKAFLMGFLHDIGYEFSEKSTEHPAKGIEMLSSFTNMEWGQMLFAILTHGKPQQYIGTVYQTILNEADLTIDHIGTEVTMEQRCNEIKDNYGEQSTQYLNAVKMKNRLTKSTGT